MTTITLYHNPKCSKSRTTLALLIDKGIKPSIVLYLDNPPSIEQLQTLVNQLGFNSARQIMRTKEQLYQELYLDGENITEQQLFNAMHRYPILIERPIVVNNHRAIIGRPPEKIWEIF